MEILHKLDGLEGVGGDLGGGVRGESDRIHGGEGDGELRDEVVDERHRGVRRDVGEGQRELGLLRGGGEGLLKGGLFGGNHTSSRQVDAQVQQSLVLQNPEILRISQGTESTLELSQCCCGVPEIVPFAVVRGEFQGGPLGELGEKGLCLLGKGGDDLLDFGVLLGGVVGGRQGDGREGDLGTGFDVDAEGGGGRQGEREGGDGGEDQGVDGGGLFWRNVVGFLRLHFLLHLLLDLLLFLRHFLLLFPEPFDPPQLLLHQINNILLYLHLLPLFPFPLLLPPVLLPPDLHRLSIIVAPLLVPPSSILVVPEKELAALDVEPDGLAVLVVLLVELGEARVGLLSKVHVYVWVRDIRKYYRGYVVVRIYSIG